METRLKLKPGQKGTKKLVEEYGDSLVCVRYRYDAASKCRIKTVEIVVERKSWNPPPTPFSPDDLVPVRIAYSDGDLKAMAKKAGGRWNPDVKLWFVRYGNLKGTLLEQHVVVAR